MTDLSKLSDAELQKLYGGMKPAADMSDDELKAAYGSQNPKERTLLGVLTGSDGGERYQTWPERAIRNVASLPKRTIDAATQFPPGSRESIDAMVPTATETALTMSPVNPAIRAGDRIIPGEAMAMRAEKPVVPTTEELKASGVAGIKGAQQSDLRISPTAVADWSQQVQQDLFKSGIHPVRASDTYKVLKELETAPPRANFTPANLQTLRETLGSIAQNFNPNAAKDQAAASRAIGLLDNFLPSVGAKDVVAGATSAAPATRAELVAQAMAGKREADRVGDLFKQGRGDFAAAMRSNDVTGVLDRATTGILERAEARAQAANSGRNIDNTIRSKVAAALEKPKEISGLNDAEIAAMSRVAEGGTGRNIARYVGNLAGGGGGLGQSTMAMAGAGAGGFVGGIPGAIVGAAIPASVGAIGKGIANQLAKRDVNALDELLRKRSPLYEQRVANPNMTPVSPEARAAVLRALMANQFSE